MAKLLSLCVLFLSIKFLKCFNFYKVREKNALKQMTESSRDVETHFFIFKTTKAS